MTKDDEFDLDTVTDLFRGLQVEVGWRQAGHRGQEFSRVMDQR